VKRILFVAALTGVVTACELSTDPLPGVGGTGPGGGAVTQLQASGDWSLALRRTTTFACSGGSLPDNQVILLHLDFTAGGIATSTSAWQAPPSSTVRALSGTVSFSSGITTLTLFATGTTSSGMELLGTLTAAGSFSGTLTDPAPGLLTPVFGTTPCEYTATGTKTS
jgi:hypothetical protein